MIDLEVPTPVGVPYQDDLANFEVTQAAWLAHQNAENARVRALIDAWPNQVAPNATVPENQTYVEIINGVPIASPTEGETQDSDSDIVFPVEERRRKAIARRYALIDACFGRLGRTVFALARLRKLNRQSSTQEMANQIINSGRPQKQK